MHNASRTLRFGIITALLLGVFALPGLTAGVAAQADPLERACRDNPNATVCQDRNQQQSFSSNSFFGANGILTRVARLIAIATGIVSVAMIIFGGYKYVTAGGDSSKLLVARDTILYALAGLVIAAVAQAIVVYVLNAL